MAAAPELGVAHFLAHIDPLGRTILIVLVAMSLMSWYLIVSRCLQHLIDWRRAEAFERATARSGSLAEVARHLDSEVRNDPTRSLAAQVLTATRNYQLLREQRADAHASELFMRDVDDAVAMASTRMDRGLIVLASIGSSAPYVGLLGTVWGVYHALVAIGLSGQGTLDQVAGPVGEALIMTALGLAVAIPAVLGYNGLVRANRVALARLNSLAGRLARLATREAAPQPATDVPGGTHAAPALGVA